MAEPIVPRTHREAWWRRMSKRMDRASLNFSQQVKDTVLLRRDLDEEFYSDLTEILIAADAGIPTASELVERLRERVRLERIGTAEEALAGLKTEMLAVLNSRERELNLEGSPAVMLLVGVNGSGKTTTLGKLAHRFKTEGRTCVIAAADTFRAAAIDQLKVWADRSGTSVVAHQPGADAGAVVFDAITAAKARGAEIVLVDTAGRLHTKSNLMEELRKVSRVVERATGLPAQESLLVVEAPTGLS